MLIRQLKEVVNELKTSTSFVKYNKFLQNNKTSTCKKYSFQRPLGYRAPNPMFKEINLSKQELEVSVVEVNNLAGEVLCPNKDNKLHYKLKSKK